MAIVARACVALLEAAGRMTPPSILHPAAAAATRRMILFYRRYLSPWSGRRCLFRVSCSEYAADAFAVQGWNGGIDASLRRIRQCGSSYSLASDIEGRLTLVTGDGTEFGHDELAGWLPTRSATEPHP